MSRQEIGNYLGLAAETVSRLLTRFQQKGLIHIDHKKIYLKRPNLLHQIVKDDLSIVSRPSNHTCS